MCVYFSLRESGVLPVWCIHGPLCHFNKKKGKRETVGSGDQLLHQLHRLSGRNRDSGMRELRGNSERGACYKAKSSHFGKNCSQWERALGPKQEPDEPVTVSIILLSGVSVSWDAGCWSYSCRVTVPIVSCEHDNKAAMWTKGWGSRLLTPLCTGQLDCSLRWKGKQMNSQQSALEIRKNKSELDPMIIRLVK